MDEFSPNDENNGHINKISTGVPIMSVKPNQLSSFSPYEDYSSGTMLQSPILGDSPDQKYHKKNNASDIPYKEVSKEREGR